MKYAIALAAMLAASPAQALTLTNTPISYGADNYGGVITYSFLFGPTNAPELEAIDLSGILTWAGCYNNCGPFSVNQQAIYCGLAPTCLVEGSFYAGPYSWHEQVPPTTGYMIWAYFPYRPLIYGWIDVPDYPVPVPLPAALPLLAGALAGLGYFGWRRRS